MAKIRILLLFCFAGILLSWGLGCSDDAEPGSADVVIDTVDPEAGYEGIEVSLEFSITPGERTDSEGMNWRVSFGDGSQVSGSGVEGSVDHTFERAGEYEITVHAVYDGSNVGQASTDFAVFAPVDLVAGDVAGRPGNLRTGDTVTLSVDVSNARASDVLTSFEVGFYLSESAEVDTDELDDLPQLAVTTATADVDGAPVLETGDTRSIGASVELDESVLSGDYFVVALVDPRVQIGDDDRMNNLAVSQTFVRVENIADSAPDLVASDLFINPDRAFPELNAFSRGFRLANRGGADAFDVVVRTYLSVGDAELDDSDVLVGTSDPIDVFSGEDRDIGPTSFVLDEAIIPNDEEISVWVIVEVDSTEPGFEDANPADNQIVSDPPIVVSDEPVDGPDIVVNSFNVSPLNTFLNGTLEIETSIENQGTQDVGSFFCGIYLGSNPRVNTQSDPRLSNINLPNLPAGEARDLDRLIVIPGLYNPGVYYLYIVCDPTNTLQEPFRSNNSQVFPDPVTITDEADVDLRIESVSLPTDVTEGDAFEVVARICAGGSNPTGTTTGALFRSAGIQLDYDGEPLLEFSIPNVNPGECEDIAIEIEASCDDFIERYVYGVEVDIEDVLPETNESNNRRAGEAAQTIDGTFCSCDDDGFEPNDTIADAASIAAGTYDATVCDPGVCDFFAVDLVEDQSLVVKTRLESSKGELVTSLFNPTGVQQLDTSDAADEQSVGAFLVSDSAPHFIRVCGASSSDRNLYELEVDVFDPSTTVDVVPRSVSVPSQSFFSVGATLDVDARIYNLGLLEASGFDAQVVATPNQTLGDGDDVVLANVSAGSVPGRTFRDLTIPATLPLSLMDGDYYLAVVLDPGVALSESDTSNNVAFSRLITVGRECFDALEPNNSFSDATVLTAGTYSNLNACTLSRDYYRVCPSDAQRMTATVTFDSMQGDIDLFLHDQQTVEIDSSAGIGGIEQVSVPYVNGDQCYFVQVRVQSLPGQFVELPYDLDIEIEDVDPALRCDGAFEPNDSFDTASSFIAAENQTFTMDRCPQADTDFYYIDLTSGQEVDLTASLDPAVQAGLLRIQLYLPSQAPGPNEETGPGVSDAEISNYVAPTTGRYYVQITVAGSQRNVTYRLASSGLTGIDLTPRNASIGPGSYLPGEEVRLGFEIANLGSDTAVAPQYEVYFGTQATLDTGVDLPLDTFFAPDIAGNASVTLNERVNVPAGASSGSAYLHVLVDPADTFSDTDRTNNTVSVPITIAP